MDGFSSAKWVACVELIFSKQGGILIMRWKVVAGLGGAVVLVGGAVIISLLPFWGSKNMPIIDAHMHMYQWNKYGDPPEPNLITRNVPTARSDAEAVDAYIAEMERHNIVLAIGSGEMTTVEEWRKRAPGKFIGGIEFPRFTKPVYQRRQDWPNVDELRQLFEDGTLGILGEVTAQYAGLSPEDSQFDAYFSLAAEMDVPVSFHSGFGPPMSAQRGDPGFRMRLGNPLLLEDVLVKYPRLRVYIAHGGYPYLDNTIALMMQYQQVYVDLSAISWLLTEDEFNTYLKRLIQARLEDRILFGTDQMIWPETVGLAIAAIDRAGFLTTKQKRKIFFENAVNFFDLEREVLLGGESAVGPNGKIVRVIRGTIELRPREPGAYEEVKVDLDLSGVTSSAVRVKGFDVDATEEVVMTINGTEVPLPPEIVSDMQERSVTVELPEGVLTNGTNTIGFLFAKAVGGTTGYAIHDLRILLRK